jgi:hypothetical protein
LGVVLKKQWQKATVTQSISKGDTDLPKRSSHPLMIMMVVVVMIMMTVTMVMMIVVVMNTRTMIMCIDIINTLVLLQLV